MAAPMTTPGAFHAVLEEAPPVSLFGSGCPSNVVPAGALVGLCAGPSCAGAPLRVRASHAECIALEGKCSRVHACRGMRAPASCCLVCRVDRLLLRRRHHVDVWVRALAGLRGSHSWCVVTCGVVIKVLIPTYLKAPPEEYTPYLQQALRPCLPIVLPGVTAKTWQGEFKKSEHALMQWYKVGRGRVGVLCSGGGDRHVAPRDHCMHVCTNAWRTMQHS